MNERRQQIENGIFNEQGTIQTKVMYFIQFTRDISIDDK